MRARDQTTDLTGAAECALRDGSLVAAAGSVADRDRAAALLHLLQEISLLHGHRRRLIKRHHVWMAQTYCRV